MLCVDNYLESHEDLGERVVVFAVPQPGETFSLDDITEYTGDNVAVYKRSEQLEVVEVIPRNPVGKIVKTDLREPPEATESAD